MMFYKILMTIAAVASLAIVAAAFVWCDAKTAGMKRAAEVVRDVSTLACALVLIAFVAQEWTK